MKRELLLDEQFHYVGASSGAEQVGSDQEFKTHIQNNLPIEKNGYLYVYVSNETPNIEVFFDNLQVSHVRGPLLEETHYYPFGLAMQGISSKAAGSIENRRKFNEGTELNSDFDVSLYETPFRSYDPQLGRFHQIDPLAEMVDAWSPYTYSLNNPILLNDPLGLLGDTVTLPEVTVVSNRIPRTSLTPTPVVVPANGTPTPTVNNNNTATAVASALPLVGATRDLRVAAGVIVGYTLYSLSQYEFNGVNPAIPAYNTAARDNATRYAPPVVMPPITVPQNPAIPATAQPQGEQYTLRARADGWYPGFTYAQGQTYSLWLKKGEIWKIGTTINGPGRYTNSEYNNTGAGLYYQNEFTGPMDQVLFLERMKLLNYAIQHNGLLPPGNTKLQ